MTTEIVVACSDSGHEGKVANIIKLKLGSDGRWLMGPVTARAQLWPRPYEQYLVGDTPVDPDGRLDRADKLAARGRHTIECPRCGLKVDAREETLFPILDKLAANGVFMVELKDLAAIVTNTSPRR